MILSRPDLEGFFIFRIMEKLTILDLAKYLPYELEYLSGDKTEKAACLDAVDGVIASSDICSIIDNTPRGMPSPAELLMYIKPILRPLSQIVEEITHEGKTFVPIVELAKAGVDERPDFGKWNAHIAKTDYRKDSKNCIFYNLDFDYDSRFNKHSAVFWATQKRGQSYLSFDVYNKFGGSVYMLENQENLFQLLYSWHFWTGNQGHFKRGLLIEKSAK